MARRNGRPGAYLMTDDYTGFTRYNTELKRDFWGAYAKKPLKRNLQEIAIGLNDPRPVPVYRGPDYEATRTCIGETAPFYVGLTTVPTNPDNMAIQSLDLFPSVGNAEIGCTLVVYPTGYTP